MGILLAFAAIVLAIGAWMHTTAFNKASAAVVKSDIAPIFGRGLKVLWLEDSTIAIVLAIVFAAAAIRPGAASKAVIILLALVPVITAVLAFHRQFRWWSHVSGRRRRRNFGCAFLSSADKGVKTGDSGAARIAPVEAGLCNFSSFELLRKFYTCVIKIATCKVAHFNFSPLNSHLSHL